MYRQFFFLWATQFGKRTLKTTKIIGISLFKLLCKGNNMSDLRKVGLKIRE